MQIIGLITMIILLVVFNVLKQNPAIAEGWTRSFGKFYVELASTLTSWIPFSFTELSVAALVGFIIFFIIKIIFSFIRLDIIGASNKIFTIINAVVGVFLVYTMSCEFAYNRYKVDLPFYETKVESSEFKDIYNYYAEDLNNCIDALSFTEDGDIKSNLSIRDISSLVEESYKIINSDYYYNSNAHAKPMISSFIYRELQLTGVTFSPYGEANINYLATKLELPLVIAHELAHTKGVMREDDANQVAFYVCLNSDNEYVRFSAYGIYFYQMRAMTSNAYISEEDIEDLIPIKSEYFKAIQFASDYWKKYERLSNVGETINNAYITSSGVSSGTESYSSGTEISQDPVTLELQPSLYQKLFFEKYYRNK